MLIFSRSTLFNQIPRVPIGAVTGLNDTVPSGVRILGLGPETVASFAKKGGERTCHIWSLLCGCELGRKGGWNFHCEAN